ncbi:hypothetical protein X743_11335 [Mesorhizobium sp. LNHC252B00]|nr:hypothetical protein X743_11335 [Mesorhizobium sp. LNHC252B00]
MTRETATHFKLSAEPQFSRNRPIVTACLTSS